MKKWFLLLFFLMNINIGFTQNQMQKNAIESFKLNYNNNDFEKIYQSFSIKMKNAHSKQYYFDFFSRAKKGIGSLINAELVDYRENSKKNSRAQYNGTFEYGNCTIKITMNGQNEIIGLYLLKDKNFM